MARWPRALEVSRRAVLRAGATAGAVAVGGQLLSGTVRAAPVAGSGVITLIYQSNWQGAPWNDTAIKLCQEFMDSSFNADPRFRGLRAVVYPGGWGNATGIMAMALAQAPGTPDVIHSAAARTSQPTRASTS
jgi:hypothetical protein